MSASASRYIVDASIAIKWLFDDEDFSSEARQILVAYQQGKVTLLAPDHFNHEVLNAIRAGVRMQRLNLDDARGAMRDFLALAIPTVAGSGMLQRGFEYALRHDCAFYDGLYLALLADSVGCPFVHADGRLRNTLGGGYSRELWIENYQRT